ncbi:MAG TPA: hypothetical protein VGR87_07685 [Candidatus Limnocylindria bacterium]|nr:hypothetical protein [Candidatus Limnocylindria bacterium]
MVRSRLTLAAVIIAIPLASCGARPGVTVSIAGEKVPIVLSSTTEGTRCSTSHGDAFPENVPLTTVRMPAPVTLRFDAGQGASEIRGWIYDLDAPSPAGGPIEEFTLPGRGGAHQARSIVPERTYRVLVNVRWSFLVTEGEETHVFRLRVETP